MRERPILFNGAMVRAILAGHKVQTRRAVKWNKVAPGLNLRFTGLSAQRYPKGWVIESDSRTSSEWRCQPTPCPFGQPGDRLWVREAHAIFPAHGQHRADGERWGPWGGMPTIVSDDGKQIAYYREGFDRCDPSRWRPSIHMPRWACRLVLEITAVRVERLQQITADDCLAEGVSTRFKVADAEEDLRVQWRDLWTSTGGDWDSNPWVWVIEFKRVEGACG